MTDPGILAKNASVLRNREKRGVAAPLFCPPEGALGNAGGTAKRKAR